MFEVKIQKRVIEGRAEQPGEGAGWLTKRLELPFIPAKGMEISFPFRETAIMPSANITVSVQSVFWSDRDKRFTVNCSPQYLIDLEKPELSEANLADFLALQVEYAWDDAINEADFK